MKNSPERPSRDEFENRVAQYTELPDEVVWNNIDAALRPRSTNAFFPWWDTATVVFTSMLLLAIVHSSERSATQMIKMDTIASDDNLNIQQPPAAGDDFDSIAPDRFALNRPVKASMPKNSDLDQVNTITAVPTVDELSYSANSPTDSTSFETHELDLTNSDVSDSTVEGAGVITEAAQETKKTKLRRVTFYFQALPMLTFNRVIPAAMDGLTIIKFENPSVISDERLAVSFSAGIQGRLSKRLEYYGGIMFYRQNRSLTYVYQVPGESTIETDNGGGYTVSPKYHMGQLNHSMVNLGAQGGFLYHLYGKKLAHKIGAGVSFLQGLARRNAENYDNSKSQYLSYQLFYRNEMSVGKRLKFFVQPTFAHAISVNENLDAPFKLKPYSAGLGVGVLYNLR